MIRHFTTSARLGLSTGQCSSQGCGSQSGLQGSPESQDPSVTELVGALSMTATGLGQQTWASVVFSDPRTGRQWPGNLQNLQRTGN